MKIAVDVANETASAVIAMPIVMRRAWRDSDEATVSANRPLNGRTSERRIGPFDEMITVAIRMVSRADPIQNNAGVRKDL